MPEQDYQVKMQNISNVLPGTASLRLVIDELLVMWNTGRVSFLEQFGAANTCGLFKPRPAGQPPYNPPHNPPVLLWGAHVNFKANEFNSFFHELTHARCILCYQADTVNYNPGGVNNVPFVFRGNPQGAPNDSVCLDPQCAVNRRLSWQRPHCKTFLDLNLQNLLGWANVTDFTSPDPFMTAQEKREEKRNVKVMAKQNQHSAAAFDRYTQVHTETVDRGQVQKSRKWRGADGINTQRLQDERDRKKRWILERINYGLNGMSGAGDTHNEYDTVVNQMLLQTYLWGFRTPQPQQLTLGQLTNHVQASTVPPEYLYDRISLLAHEAHLRRVGNGGINVGAPATINTPALGGNAFSANY